MTFYWIPVNTRAFYSKAEEESFLEYSESELKELDRDRNTAREIFLRMYANPVINLNRTHKKLESTAI